MHAHHLVEKVAGIVTMTLVAVASRNDCDADGE